ncbi:hypothetical protein [Jatrophihabitans endophyticus]|uniref:uridine kinase family protein n=1 Tax=Jatrophihabitans endophyticus TaxID=1206085 RepID=UPI0019FBBA0F|nr:hypothetical protein [Jatrophihabitans endophyticus]MBE7189154.1 hypothetical protein [Jatrophihabitans endophyticus]
MAERAATASDVAAAVAALPGTGLRLVGIDGAGGAGKTALAARVSARLNADGVRTDVVHVDDFSSLHLAEWDWGRLREQVLLPLLAGRPARYQVWDWARDAGGVWVDLEPGGVVLVEGVSATRTEVGAPWTLTVWVEAPADVRRRRAIERDGPGMWPVWRDRWIPSEEAYFARERPAERADLVVDGTA